MVVCRESNNSNEARAQERLENEARKRAEAVAQAAEASAVLGIDFPSADWLNPQDWRVDIKSQADRKEFLECCALGTTNRCSIVVAEPHPHRDMSRFSLQYPRLPDWLRTAALKSASEAVAVVPAFPADILIVQERFLPNIGFNGPFTVIPVVSGRDPRIKHEQVMIIARRPEAPPPASFFENDHRGVVRNPVEIARRLVPQAKKALFLFRQKDSDWPSIASIVVTGGWQPWDDGDDGTFL